MGHIGAGAVDEVAHGDVNLAALVGYIVNNLNGHHIVVTADHGFLFTETARAETDKSKLKDKPDSTILAKKRYLLGPKLPDNDAAWHGKLSVTAGADGGMEFWIPKGANLFHFVGGARFVHGGAMPQEIVELRTIGSLCRQGAIVIAVGGGGVPVIVTPEGHLKGVAAVIDKDLTSAMLAAHLHADAYIMLTGVERVALDFNKPTQRWLDHMTLAEAQQHAADGQFPPGSMGPKIEAAVTYLKESPEANRDGVVIITSLEKAFDALMGRAGTRITMGAA